MEIQCVKCNAVLPAANIDLKDKVGKCDECNNLFSIKSQILTLVTKKRDEIQLPKQVQVERHRTSLLITRKWFGPVFIFLTFFCVVWDGFVFFFIGMALLKGEIAAVLFCSIHGAVGVGLTYFTIAGYLNKTLINVDSENIKIIHTPLPWPGAKTVYAGNIKQLYTKKKMYHTKNGTRYKYELHSITDDEKDSILMPSLENGEQALFLEQEIENFLKIEDSAIEGEMERA